MYNSFASERLIKLIDYKLKRYNELAASNPESKALKYIDGEIKLLQDTILPIVMENTNIGYREITNFVTKAIKALESSTFKNMTNDILIHFHLKDSGKEPSIAALFTNMNDEDVVAIDITINQKPEYIVPIYSSKPTIYRIKPEYPHIDKESIPKATVLLDRDTVKALKSRK